MAGDGRDRGVCRGPRGAGSSKLAARLVASRHQLLEDAAQHLRVDGDLDVQGRALRDGEVVVVEEGVEGLVEDRVGHRDPLPVVQGLPLEEPAVEVGHVPDQALEEALALDGHQVPFSGIVQPLEEEHLEPLVVKVCGGIALPRPEVVLPQRPQVVGAPGEGQPPLALEEDDEEQAVEEALGEEAQRLLVADARDGLFGLLEEAAVGAEEVLRHPLDVEGLVVPRLNRQGRGVGAERRQVEQGDALGGGGAAGVAPPPGSGTLSGGGRPAFFCDFNHSSPR